MRIKDQHDGITILPCPFCGKPGVLSGKFTGDDGYDYYVECNNDYCPIRPTGWIRDTAEEAISDWNTRYKE